MGSKSIIRLRKAGRSDVARTVLGLAGTQVLIVTVSLLMNLFTARVLGPTGRGEFALYTQLAQVASIFCILGVEQAYPAAVLERPTLHQALSDLWILIRWPTIVTVSLSTAAIGLVNIDSPDMPVLLLGYSTYVCVNVLLGVFGSASSASSSVRGQLVSVLLWQALLLGAGVGLVAMQVQAAPYWLLAFGATGLLPLGYGALRRTPGLRKNRSGSRLLKTRRLGIKLIGPVLLNLFLIRAERFILPWLANMHALGTYAVVASLTELVDLPIHQYLRAKMPSLAISIRSGQSNHLSLIRFGLLYGVCAGVCVGVVVSQIVVPLFGSAYQTGADLAIAFGLSVGLYSSSRVGAAICIAAHEASLNAAMDIIGTIAVVAGCLLFVPAWGIVGAVGARLAAFSILALVSVWCAVTAVRRARLMATSGLEIETPASGKPDAFARIDR